MPTAMHSFAGPKKPLSPEELADHQAITSLCQIYALGIDMRDCDLCLSVFDPDGHGKGSVGSFPLHEYITKSWQSATDIFERTQHCIVNQYVTLSGNDAKMWSYCIGYHTCPVKKGSGDMLAVGVQYRDDCRRTKNGWIICQRETVLQWRQGELPDLAKYK